MTLISGVIRNDKCINIPYTGFVAHASRSNIVVYRHIIGCKYVMMLLKQSDTDTTIISAEN
jgi:hypothetical protein